jgi:N-terminal conserved domain of Nudc./CS domain
MSLPFPTTGAESANGGTTMNMDPRQLAEMEAPLVALAQASGGDVRKLLYGFFSFLNRRTDFYVVHPTAAEGESSQQQNAYSMGFKEGDAEKLLLASFRQFPLRRLPSKAPAPSAAQSSKPSTQGGKAIREAKAPASSEENDDSSMGDATARQGVGRADEDTGGSAPASSSSKSTAGTATKSASSTVRYTEEGLQVPVGNGGSMMPTYEWTQTIDECTVLVPLPAQCQRARDLDVELAPLRLSVRPKKKKKSNDGNDNTIVEGTLTERIVPAESTWTIEGGVLVVALHKAIPTFWKSVLVGDEEIDTTLVDARRHIDEYDAETQAKLRKIMFDEQQLRQGLPTSDEILGVHPPPLPTIPTLPPGVEYINQAVLNQSRNTKRDDGPA